jgi:hypothetical protein
MPFSGTTVGVTCRGRGSIRRFAGVTFGEITPRKRQNPPGQVHALLAAAYVCQNKFDCVILWIEKHFE